jgi:hypothetical protein
MLRIHSIVCSAPNFPVEVKFHFAQAFMISLVQKAGVRTRNGDRIQYSVLVGHYQFCYDAVDPAQPCLYGDQHYRMGHEIHELYPGYETEVDVIVRSRSRVIYMF